MKKIVLVSLLALAMMMLNCQTEQADALTDDVIVKIEEIVNGELEAFFDGAEEFNSEIMSEFLSEDIHFAANGNIRIGKDATADAFDTSFRGVRSQQLTMDASHVNVLSRDYALQTVQGVFVPTVEDGVEEGRYQFALTIAWTNIRDRWLMQQYHYSMHPISNN
ncbi:MAG: hypothetical protein GF372_11940 [Candidatus Marinimicrobia bacterium]|nr:hypothetical protein [Candidatus Neomarinimicrobiota bacterium]